MAITFVGVGSTAADSTAGGTSTPGLPTGWQADDVAILVLGARFRSEFLPGGPSVSSGWDLVDSDYYDLAANVNDPFLFIYRRVLQSGDSAPTVTNTNDPGLLNEMTISFIVAFRGVDTTTPIDVSAVSDTAAAGATFTPTGLTTTTNDAWVLSSVMTADDNTIGLLSGSEQGFTLRGEDETTLGNDASIGIASKEVATAGAVTNPTWEQTVNEPDAWVAITLALRPAGGAATVTGTASGNAAASGSVVGTRSTAGTATGSADAAGTVVGTRTVSGTAAGNGEASGTATGTTTGQVSGTASGTAEATGSVTATRTTSGAASGNAEAIGAVAGTRTIFGSATGNADAAGTVAGTRTTFGTASGNAVATGIATGTSSGAGSGTASGNAAAAGSATGTRTTFGVASGAATAAGVVAGTRIVLGTASGTAAATGTATGTKTVTGVAAAVWGGVTGTVTGTRTVLGVATGDTGPFTGTVIERLVGTVQFASRPPRRRYAADRVGRAFAASTTRRRFDADRPRRSP